MLLKAKIPILLSAILTAGFACEHTQNLPEQQQVQPDSANAAKQSSSHAQSLAVAPDLGTQIETLSQLGFKLNPDVSKNDLLTILSNEEFETRPYSTLLYVMGGQLYENGSFRLISNSTWGFDTEYIHENGSYVSLINNLARLTGEPELIIGVKDTVDFSKKTAVVTYKLRGRIRSSVIEAKDDWVDTKFLGRIFDEIIMAANDGRRFYGISNGQSVTLMFIDQKTKSAIDRLAPGTLLLYS